MDKDQYFEIDNKYKHTIANLTLTGYNSNMSNKYFLDKRDMENGFKDSHLFLNKYLSKIETWNIVELEKRFEIIFDKFKTIWKYPEEIKISQEHKEEAINIFDVLDPTHKEVEYIIFFENTKIVNSFKGVYKIVISEFFYSDPNIFHTKEMKEKLKLQKHQDGLYSPLKISESYFIESGLSAKDIFNRIKLVLNTFQIYD